MDKRTYGRTVNYYYYGTSLFVDTLMIRSHQWTFLLLENRIWDMAWGTALVTRRVIHDLLIRYYRLQYLLTLFFFKH